MSEIKLADLGEPFPPSAIEWRIGRAGKKNGRIWAKVLAYVESRAIMDRLDNVCGPENWQTQYKTEDGHVTASIGIRVEDEWIWKADGAGYLASSDGLSPQDAGKGDYSNALKRAGIEWGIGRYLYGLDEGWANVHDNGERYGRLKDGTSFNWDPPQLPVWALPEAYREAREEVDEDTGEIIGDEDELVARVRDKLERAETLGAIEASAVDRIRNAIANGEYDHLRLSDDWLDTKLEAAKVGGSA